LNFATIAVLTNTAKTALTGISRRSHGRWFAFVGYSFFTSARYGSRNEHSRTTQNGFTT